MEVTSIEISESEEFEKNQNQKLPYSQGPDKLKPNNKNKTSDIPNLKQELQTLKTDFERQTLAHEKQNESIQFLNQ